MAEGSIGDAMSLPFGGSGHGSPEVRFKMALTAAAARLREETYVLTSPYDRQLLHTAKLLEAMAGEAEA